MEIIPYTPDLATRLASAYTAAAVGVPHTYPVAEPAIASAFAPGVQQLAEANRGEDGEPSRVAHPRTPMDNGAAWIALARGTVVGWVQVAIAHPKPSDDTAPGAIRSLWYASGQRTAGQGLLDKGLVYLRERGVSHVDAFHFAHRHPFYHVEHAYLTSRWGQVAALLGMNGFERFDGELVLDWRDLQIHPPASPIPCDVHLATMQGAGERRGLIVTAHTEEEIGTCACVSLGDGTAATEAQDWVYVAWLGVKEQVRGQGLGRYLLLRTLAEAGALGYRHATICTLNRNYRAQLLYTNVGFETVDWTYCWRLPLK